MRPLYYSMLLLFKDGKEFCVNDAINELKLAIVELTDRLRGGGDNERASA